MKIRKKKIEEKNSKAREESQKRIEQMKIDNEKKVKAYEKKLKNTF